MPSKCAYCAMLIYNSEAMVGEKHFHLECLVCNNCKKSLQNVPFRMRENVLYCDDCYNLVTAARCAECNGLILGKERLEAMGRFYHPRHLVCFNCKSHLIKNFFIKKLISYKEELGNRGFCVTCATNINNSLCLKCNKPLNDSLVFDGESYVHMDCENASSWPVGFAPYTSSSSSSEEESTPRSSGTVENTKEELRESQEQENLPTRDNGMLDSENSDSEDLETEQPVVNQMKNGVVNSDVKTD